ncbi:MAG: TRL-like family protein [Proteobacteria bacterium]|nr:TRL-like family protein [Pseudomonadota bacterium]
MRRRTVRLLLGIACAAVLAATMGCAAVVSPAGGGLWMDVHGPLQAGDRVGSKEGRACAKSILGLIASGDASIKAAAAAGGITKIESVDHHTVHKIFVGEFCTIVRGS